MHTKQNSSTNVVNQEHWNDLSGWVGAATLTVNKLKMVCLSEWQGQASECT